MQIKYVADWSKVQDYENKGLIRNTKAIKLKVGDRVIGTNGSHIDGIIRINSIEKRLVGEDLSNPNKSYYTYEVQGNNEIKGCSCNNFGDEFYKIDDKIGYSDITKQVGEALITLKYKGFKCLSGRITVDLPFNGKDLETIIE